MTKDFLIKQLDEVLQDFDSLKAMAKYDDLSDIQAYKVEEIINLISRAKASVARIVGTSSEYYKDILNALTAREHEGTKLRFIIGTVKALKSDLEKGYLKNLHDIIQAEIFSDYLEMSSYLINEGFKDPSAVIIGSTLEAHLRELCKANSVEIQRENSSGKWVPKKAEVMNSDLSKLGVYSLAHQKQITAWLDLRNSAAHGNYTSYSIAEIKLMLQGIKHFILTTT